MLVCKLKDHDNGESIIYKHFIGVGELYLSMFCTLNLSCHGIFMTSTRIIAQNVCMPTVVTSVYRLR